MPAAPSLTLLQLKTLRTQLLTWFAACKRDLPWRQNRDPYRIWISEIMLQQTRVAAVIPYYEKFCAHFPDIQALAAAKESEVLRLWSGLGYYSRARNLRSAAQQIVAHHAGIFPTTEAGIRALHGIGQYTTNAILSIAFDQTHAVLDGNVARVVARLQAIRGDIRESSRWQALQKSADRLLAHDSPGNWNQAMMELGATICTPRNPQCQLCPVANFCQARRLGLQDQIPEKRKKRATVEVLLAAAILTDPQGRCLILPPPKPGKKETAVAASAASADRAVLTAAAPSTRPAADHIPTLVSKMWHFPITPAGKNPEAELRRYLQSIAGAKLSLKASRFKPLKKVRHAVTYRSITVLPFHAQLTKLPAIPGTKKIPLDNLSSIPISNLTRKIAASAPTHREPTRR
jgi:A/G-specific adenine glycosylase